MKKIRKQIVTISGIFAQKITVFLTLQPQYNLQGSSIEAMSLMHKKELFAPSRCLFCYLQDVKMVSGFSQKMKRQERQPELVLQLPFQLKTAICKCSNVDNCQKPLPRNTTKANAAVEDILWPSFQLEAVISKCDVDVSGQIAKEHSKNEEPSLCQTCQQRVVIAHWLIFFAQIPLIYVIPN